ALGCWNLRGSRLFRLAADAGDRREDGARSFGGIGAAIGSLARIHTTRDRCGARARGGLRSYSRAHGGIGRNFTDRSTDLRCDLAAALDGGRNRVLGARAQSVQNRSDDRAALRVSDHRYPIQAWMSLPHLASLLPRTFDLDQIALADSRTPLARLEPLPLVIH